MSIESYPLIFGIGNPLIDIVINADDQDLKILDLNKGTMQLLDEKRQESIINYFTENQQQYFPGGSAPNTILACSGLGVNAHIAGKVGSDELGKTYLNRIKKYGSDSGLIQGSGITGSSIILVTPDGERTMNTHLGMCQEYCSDDIDTDKLSESSFLYFTGYMWDTNSQKLAIKKAIQIAQENNVKIVFDVADPYAVMRNRQTFLDLLEKNIDIAFANESEIKILFESENLEYCFEKISDIVYCGGLKLGKNGSLVFYDKQKYKIKPNSVRAIDTTGAGDMYAAGFLASIAKGKDYRVAGKNAVLLAEEVIKVQGAQLELSSITKMAEKLF